MKGVEIKPLEVLGHNSFGSTLKIDLNGKREGILAYRKAGSISGRHYHKGHSEGKNPEKLALVSGVLKLVCRHLETKEEQTYHLKAPIMIEVGPMVWHEVTAFTDIVFVEMNSIEEHAADTFREDA